MLKISESPYQQSLEYSLLNKTRGEVYGFIAGIFKRMEVFQTLGITTSDFLDFLIDIEKGYNDNPYHSFYHAVDVTMVLYHMMEQYDMSQYLTRVDLAMTMIAALCHDIGHVC
jgi:HD-GYP domain-containing protein (c-di-GMP phosphodiesterase class II)